MREENSDVRWIQRFNSYKKALLQLGEAIELATERDLSSLEKDGVIQRFEYTFEQAWESVKAFYISVGIEKSQIQGSRSAFRLAIKNGLVTNGQILLDSVESRARTSHRYDEETAEAIFHKIIDTYYGAFVELREALEKQQDNDL